MSRLIGRTALVTGSTSGIGAAIARQLAAEGAHVVVSGRSVERGESVVKQIVADGGRAAFVVADVSTATSTRALAADAIAAVGRIDVLVNNAGVYPSALTLEVDEVTYEQIMDVNVRGPLFLTQAVLPGMLERADGVIVNIGSWVAQVGFLGGALYSASKATIEQMTRGWASEFGPQGIRVNAVAPGVIISDPTSAGNEARHAMVAGTPAGRAGRVEDVALAVAYLASDDAAYVQGITLNVDGGAVATRSVA